MKKNVIFAVVIIGIVAVLLGALFAHRNSPQSLGIANFLRTNGYTLTEVESGDGYSVQNVIAKGVSPSLMKGILITQNIDISISGDGKQRLKQYEYIFKQAVEEAGYIKGIITHKEQVKPNVFFVVTKNPEHDYLTVLVKSKNTLNTLLLDVNKSFLSVAKKKFINKIINAFGA